MTLHSEFPDLRCRFVEGSGIAVTGSTGYLGRLTLEALGSEGIALAAQDLPKRVVIVHLAADVRPTREAFLANAALDTAVADLTRERDGGLVYASGNNVYGTGLDLGCELQPAWNDYYGASKVVGEAVAAMRLPAAQLHRVRIADVFGPGQRHGNFFKAMAAAICERRALPQHGDGLKARSYIYAPEAARYLAWAAARMRQGLALPTVVNLCHPGAVTLAHIVETLARMAVLPVERIAGPSGATDVRVMVPGPTGDYTWQWPGMDDALADFVAHSY